MAVWVVPDAQLELFLVHVDIVDVQVTALHEVGEDFLHHSEADRVALYSEMLPEIEIGEVEAWREEHSLVEHGRPGDGFFFDDEICRLHHSEDSLVDCVALGVKQRQALAPDLHCSRINKLVWLFSISSFLFFSLRSYMDLTELSLNFSFILIEAVLHDYKWMLKLDVEARAERALLQL